MKRRRPLFAVAALALLAVAAALFWPRHRSVVLTGMVTTEGVIVSSDVPGRLAELNVREGDTVTAGQVVAVIEPPEFADDLTYYQSVAHQAQAQSSQAQADLTFTRAQTSAAISQAEANLSAAQAQAQAAAADLENARLNFQRARELRAKGTNSVQEFDQARTAYDGAEARAAAAQKQAAAARAALDLARAGDQQVTAREAAAQAARDQARGAAAEADKARVRLGYTEVRAPIPAIVDVRAARMGEVVNAGQPIVSLIDPDDLWVRVDIEETFVDQVHLGDKLEVRLPSGAKREGVVFYRAVVADYATQRDVSRTKRDIRTFELRLRCDNRDRALAVGMTAYVTLPR